MALVSLVAALLGTSLSNPADTICRPYVGHQVTTRTFEEVRSSLPVVPAKGKYESTADYEKRLATALAPVGPVIIRQSLPYRGLDYDADRGQLKIHQTAFGAGETNFGNLLGSGGMTSRADNFSGVIGLMVGVSETMTDTYDAANGFGAHFTVTRTSRSVDAVWERPGDIRQSMFIDAKPFGPIAQFNVSSSVAQDLIEAGSSVSRSRFVA